MATIAPTFLNWDGVKAKPAALRFSLVLNGAGSDIGAIVPTDGYDYALVQVISSAGAPVFNWGGTSDGLQANARLVSVDTNGVVVKIPTTGASSAYGYCARLPSWITMQVTGAGSATIIIELRRFRGR